MREERRYRRRRWDEEAERNVKAPDRARDKKCMMKHTDILAQNTISVCKKRPNVEENLAYKNI